ncbi:hypothetical protein [Palleronia marisminoris]|uniref:hypothetical protein n=1 Tax=Palleronia marisminoris TaxID=315423 RepID=UPI001587F756|nr:hypothetical protein [Palleronia marisminoris]
MQGVPYGVAGVKNLSLITIGLFGFAVLFGQEPTNIALRAFPAAGVGASRSLF